MVVEHWIKMNNTTDIGAIIAAKGTSTRVPDKNIRPFGDTNLLELKINQFLKLNLFYKINQKKLDIPKK